MTIQDIMTMPNSWQDSEVVVFYTGQPESETFSLCSDEHGFYLQGDNIVIREFEELGDNVDRLQISIVY